MSNGLDNYFYYRTDEQIKRYSTLSPREKLQCIEEMRRFNHRINKSNPEREKTAEYFRQLIIDKTNEEIEKDLALIVTEAEKE